MPRSKRRKPYPSDLTDNQWAVLEPLIPDAKPGGLPRKAGKRRIVEAILYQLRAGSAWRLLPHDFPPSRRSTTICAAGRPRVFGQRLTIPF
jgi:transposase